MFDALWRDRVTAAAAIGMVAAPAKAAGLWPTGEPLPAWAASMSQEQQDQLEASLHPMPLAYVLKCSLKARFIYLFPLFRFSRFASPRGCFAASPHPRGCWELPTALCERTQFRVSIWTVFGERSSYSL